MDSILLIDDKPDELEGLASSLRAEIGAAELDIRQWVPADDGVDPKVAFAGKIDAGTRLVVTDYDLTGSGRTGLFGATIVDWCQAEGIPVGDYSKGSGRSLPKEPNLFELRVPVIAAGAHIASLFRGFQSISKSVEARAFEGDSRRNPAAALADVLGVPELEDQLSLYGAGLGSSAQFVERAIRESPARAPVDLKQRILAYVLGHLLLNSVLRFPGPILPSRALLAYVACGESELATLAGIFSTARYSGPFSELDQFFWLSRAEGRLAELAEQLGSPVQCETHGEYHRRVLEKHLNRVLARPSCPRCSGENGGFFCPLTKRTVCHRSECSVGASSWIPGGATICRVERDFYEEWAPILGM
jgi:hypothetical protein